MKTQKCNLRLIFFHICSTSLEMCHKNMLKTRFSLKVCIFQGEYLGPLTDKNIALLDECLDFSYKVSFFFFSMKFLIF